jgi:hypothetical protein
VNPIDLEMLEQSVQRRPVAINLVTLALQALSGRALVWAAFLGASALWTLAMLEPSTIKTIVAVGYCVTVLAPILVRDTKG